MLPHSIVLTYTRCDYCEKADERSVLIYENFGIKTCVPHYDLGKRDCDSYLYLNKMIHLQDVKQLVDALPETFPVKRTSGEMQDGWSVDSDNPYIRQVDGEWHLSCVNKEYNLTKKPSIKNMKHLIDVEFIEGIITKAQLQQSLRNSGNPVLEEYKEHPCVQREMVGGVECRVFRVSHPDSA